MVMSTDMVVAKGVVKSAAKCYNDNNNINIYNWHKYIHIYIEIIPWNYNNKFFSHE